MSFFVLNEELHSTCDFNSSVLKKGVNIYEVLRVETGVPLFLQEHISRFFSSAALEDIPINITKKFIGRAVKLLIKQNRMQQGNIKFIYHWNGQDDIQFMAWVMPFFYPSTSQYTDGVTVGHMQAERKNPNAKKMLNDLRQQADRLLKTEKLREVVYVNSAGYLTEGSRSNIFFVMDNYLLTPELALVLPGITRTKVLQLAAARGIQIQETKIKLSDMEKFDACFLTGTSPKLLPVLQFDNHKFDVHNTLMRALMKDYDNLTQMDINNFSW